MGGPALSALLGGRGEAARGPRVLAWVIMAVCLFSMGSARAPGLVINITPLMACGMGQRAPEMEPQEADKLANNRGVYPVEEERARAG